MNQITKSATAHINSYDLKMKEFKKQLQSKLKLWGSIFIIVAIFSPLFLMNHKLPWNFILVLKILFWLGIVSLICGYAIPMMKYLKKDSSQRKKS